MSAVAGQLADTVPAFVRVGRTAVPFEGYAAASQRYRDTIDALGIGASQTPPCTLHTATGRVVGHVSYNGKVWPGAEADWLPGTQPLFNPYGAA